MKTKRSSFGIRYGNYHQSTLSMLDQRRVVERVLLLLWLVVYLAFAFFASMKRSAQDLENRCFVLDRQG